MLTLLCILFGLWLLLSGGAAAAGALIAGLGLTTFFVVGSVGFWVLLLLACAALCFADERRSGAGATAVVGVTLLLLVLWGGFRPWPWLASNWRLALLGFVAYFAFGGGLWAVFMLRRRAKEELAKYERAFDLYLINCGAKSEAELTPEQRWQWQEHRRKGRYVNEFWANKSMAELKSSILYWICYWPTSLLWYLLSDLVKEIADEIFRRMQGFYQKVWDAVWKDARGSF
jgi:hypothetical protein